MKDNIYNEYKMKDLKPIRVYGLKDVDLELIGRAYYASIHPNQTHHTHALDVFMLSMGNDLFRKMLSLFDTFDRDLYVKSKPLEDDAVNLVCKSSDGRDMLIRFDYYCDGYIVLSVMDRFEVRTFTGKIVKGKFLEKSLIGKFHEPEDLSPNSYLGMLYDKAYAHQAYRAPKNVENSFESAHQEMSSIVEDQPDPLTERIRDLNELKSDLQSIKNEEQAVCDREDKIEAVI